MTKVSAIIPVYNVSSFIRKSVKSLMGQTLQDVEFIFVDDSTPDDSIEILEGELKNYPHRTGQVRIIHHQQNKGLPSARNTGLKAATGEYVYHCDSDDWMEPEMLEKMYALGFSDDQIMESVRRELK